MAATPAHGLAQVSYAAIWPIPGGSELHSPHALWAPRLFGEGIMCGGMNLPRQITVESSILTKPDGPDPDDAKTAHRAPPDFGNTGLRDFAVLIGLRGKLLQAAKRPVIYSRL